MAGEDSGRISVSRDALRAELAQMELRLIEKLATKAEVEMLEARVDTLETEVDRLKTWRKTLAAALAFAVAVALAALPELVRHYTG